MPNEIKKPFVRISNTLTFQQVRILRVKHKSALFHGGPELNKDQDSESENAIVTHRLGRKDTREVRKLAWAKTSNSRSFQIDRMARAKHEPGGLTKEKNWQV